jgi:ribosomal protein L40E
MGVLMVKVCPVCGAKSPDEYRFCIRCNAKLPDEDKPSFPAQQSYAVPPQIPQSVAQPAYNPPTYQPPKQNYQPQSFSQPITQPLNTPPQSTAFPSLGTSPFGSQTSKRDNDSENLVSIAFILSIVGTLMVIAAAALYIRADLYISIGLIGALVVPIGLFIVGFWSNTMDKIIRGAMFIASAVIIATSVIAIALLK